MTYRFRLTDVIPARPRQIYDAWLDSRGHRAITGGKARQSAMVGATVTAWDGYITGKNLELVPGKRIVQSWRTTKFTDAHKDSRITVTLKAVICQRMVPTLDGKMTPACEIMLNTPSAMSSARTKIRLADNIFQPTRFVLVPFDVDV